MRLNVDEGRVNAKLRTPNAKLETVNMIRKAFLMTVNPDAHAEYERRHRPIWAELEVILKAHGVANYSIFLDAATNQLFGYAEIESEERWKAIAETDECRRWWAFMKDVMPSNPDNSPVSRELREVFHID
jgi:L-rhamnose mutarotase